MKKIHLKHIVEQWKLGASMKNTKEKFGVSRQKEEKIGVYKKKKNLESLEIKD